VPFNSQVARTDASALMPEDVQREIIENVPQQSAIMRLARRLPNMSRIQRRLPILSALASAFFVTGDTGQKQTSQMAWANKFINAEELAVIVPIPEAVLDDQDYDLWAEIRPRIEEAIGLAFDQAVLYGTNAPASWPTNVLSGANTAGTKLSLATQQAAGKDLYDAVLGDGGLASLVEQNGYNVSGYCAHLQMKGKLRGLRDAEGQPIFKSMVQAKDSYTLDGNDLIFPLNGSQDVTQSLLFGGDWSQLVYAIRQDITFKILDQAVITDGAGVIQFNLAQQDMVALRAVIRLGWQLPNPINRINTNAATRYPFGVLAP
jgi:HK97 family phage major capsid protein